MDKLAGFSARVHAETLNGATVATGWGIFHRWSIIGTEDYADWDGYVELEPDDSVRSTDRWLVEPFRVVADDENWAYPSITVRVRNWRPLGDDRVGVLVVEEDPPMEAIGRWPNAEYVPRE